MWIFHSSKAIVEEAGVQAGSFLFSSAHLASDVGSWYPEGLLLWLLICTAFMCFSPMLAFWIIKMQDYYQTSLFLGNSNSAGRLLLCVCVCVPLLASYPHHLGETDRSQSPDVSQRWFPYTFTSHPFLSAFSTGGWISELEKSCSCLKVLYVQCASVNDRKWWCLCIWEDNPQLTVLL